MAAKAIQLAEEELGMRKEVGETREHRVAHVGYYLMDVEGCACLEASLEYHSPWNIRFISLVS